MQFYWYILGTALSGLLSIFFGFFVYFNNRQKIARVFLAFSLSFSLWLISYAIWLSQTTYIDALLWSRLLNLGATLIPIFYLHWITIILELEIKHKHLIITGYIATIFYTFFAFSSLYINKLIPISAFPFWPQANTIYILFIFTLLLPFFIYGTYLLGKTYFLDSTDEILRIQCKYMFIGSILSIIGGGSNFLSMFGVSIMAPLLTQLTIIQSILWAYSSLRFKLFNIRAFVVEILIFILWIIISLRVILFIKTPELLTEGALLITIIVLGIYIILGFKKEVKTREKIEKLALDLKLLNSTLEQKVTEQTQEVRRAFELEKKAKRDLEKLNETKDQFIMITQHNLRTPVTSIRWELEAMLSGTYGTPNVEMTQALNDTNISVKHLTRIVDDFLNITAIKAGSQILKLSPVSLKQSLEDVLTELKIDIEERKIIVKYPTDQDCWPILKIDEHKMREVFLIIIENAIRYNVDNGNIIINNKVENDNFIMTIENTGIGIVNKDTTSLFNRLFFRSKQAQSVNPSGMGIGLFVSRAILKAHHGDIKIYSEGENKGATVILTVPLNYIKNIETENS